MTNKTTINIVVVFLGLIAFATVVGGFWLANNSRPIPATLVALGSAALGGITGLLAHTSSVDPTVPKPPLET